MTEQNQGKSTNRGLMKWGSMKTGKSKRLNKDF